MTECDCDGLEVDAGDDEASETLQWCRGVGESDQERRLSRFEMGSAMNVGHLRQASEKHLERVLPGELLPPSLPRLDVAKCDYFDKPKNRDLLAGRKLAED